MQLAVRRHHGIAVVALRGEVLGEDGLKLRSALEHAIDGSERETPSLIVVIDEVRRMDSSALGALVYAQSHARTRGGRMAVVGGTSDIARLLELSQLTAVLERFPDLQSALASLEPSNQGNS